MCAILQKGQEGPWRQFRDHYSYHLGSNRPDILWLQPWKWVHSGSVEPRTGTPTRGYGEMPLPLLIPEGRASQQRGLSSNLKIWWYLPGRLWTCIESVTSPFFLFLLLEMEMSVLGLCHHSIWKHITYMVSKVHSWWGILPHYEPYLPQFSLLPELDDTLMRVWTLDFIFDAGMS